MIAHHVPYQRLRFEGYTKTKIQILPGNIRVTEVTISILKDLQRSTGIVSQTESYNYM